MPFDDKKIAELKQKFAELDTDKSGYLDRAELVAGVKKIDPSFNESELDSLIQQADKNKDNKISFEEFLHLIELKHL
jgi:Ca2+-binding EF-hand superfamily protein